MQLNIKLAQLILEKIAATNHQVNRTDLKFEGYSEAKVDVCLQQIYDLGYNEPVDFTINELSGTRDLRPGYITSKGKHFLESLRRDNSDNDKHE